MAAEYRIFEDAVLGTGAFAVKASNIDPEHGIITRDNPMIIEVSAATEPSLRWECLNDEAQEAMDRLVAKKNADDQTYDGYDPKTGQHVRMHDTGTHQRARFARFVRSGGTAPQTLEEQGIKVKPKPKKAKRPVQAAMSESHDQVTPAGKKAI